MRFGAMVIVCLGVMGPLSAHPLPSFQFDRWGTVAHRGEQLEIIYKLDISLFAMAIDARGVLTPQDEQAIGGRQAEFAKVYATKKAPLIADAVIVLVDDKALSLKSKVRSISFEETHAIFEFVLTGTIPNDAKSIAIEDLSFEEKPGQIVWRFEPRDGFSEIVEAVDLVEKPILNLTPAEATRRRKLSAKLVSRQSPTPEPITEQPTIVMKDESLWKSIQARGLVALFDSQAGLGVLLLASLAFGAAHAVTPGHGKTLVAAYLVGERGTIGHAVLLGVSTTLSHTGSVIAVAVLLRWIYRDGVPETVQGVLQMVGGLLILGLGGWLLMQRARNRADHFHFHPQAGEKPHWFRVVLLGLAGGIVPCWDAVMLLLVAISAGRLALALPLLLAFSFGLAAVLVALGVSVVLATRAGGKRFGESRWFRALPIVSALGLVLIGLWFFRDGWHTLTKADAVHANR